MTFQLGTNSMKNMEGIDDRLIDIAELAITLSPVDFGVPSSGGFRSTKTKLNCTPLANLSVTGQLTSHITKLAKPSMCSLTLTERPVGTPFTLPQSPLLCCRVPAS